MSELVKDVLAQGGLAISTVVALFIAWKLYQDGRADVRELRKELDQLTSQYIRSKETMVDKCHEQNTELRLLLEAEYKRRPNVMRG